jgi:hypothetical protein
MRGRMNALSEEERERIKAERAGHLGATLYDHGGMTSQQRDALHHKGDLNRKFEQKQNREMIQRIYGKEKQRRQAKAQAKFEKQQKDERDRAEVSQYFDRQRAGVKDHAHDQAAKRILTAHAFDKSRFAVTATPDEKKQAKEKREKREIEQYKERQRAGIIDPKRDQAAARLLSAQERQEAAAPAVQRDEQQRRDQEQQRTASTGSSTKAETGNPNKEMTDKAREKEAKIKRFLDQMNESERQHMERGGGRERTRER